MDLSIARQAVLIVDDDPDMVSGLSRLVKMQGYEADSSSTIREALAREDWDRFLAVILDRRLPDGVIDEFLPDFRERDPEIAIIIATGFTDLEGTISALREQVEDYLIKPVNPDLLLARLARIAENRAARDSVRKLEQEVVHAVEEEKRRIAMELHDGLGSLLGGIRMQCHALEASLTRNSHEDEARRAEEIDILVKDAIAQARSLSRGLHPVPSEPQGLQDALEHLVANFSHNGQIECIFHCASPSRMEDPIAANHLFRIAQEAVNNAIRHGQCSQIVIDLEDGDAETILRIIDNGIGLDAEETKVEGIGLHTMRYRARAIGATLTFDRPESGGTEVRCRIPKEAR